jgi:uncharacterized protein (DUF488 family)
LQDLVTLLRTVRIQTLVDIRTVPRSRFNPQFNREQLEKDLRELGLEYIHFPALGGLRKPRPDSVNNAWKNDSFRGFADYMATSEFDLGIAKLIEMSRKQPTVIMCAEAVPWRWHRSLVSDSMTVRGVKVRHIISRGKTKEHTLTEFARADGVSITYPAAPTDEQTRML